ncbi:unnamed protein product [Rhizoctonia solani]|uniref:Uncharacterized protein n=1 Tax=Rhizoctonia solani TaxID=456999 RepID=A0A8H3BC03_9AGAM|nr:unnamed protein product [Rhizoctonia solani]
MSAVNTSTKHGAAGSRLAQITTQVKMLLQKDTYVNGFKNSVLTGISILSIFALYSVIITVWLRNKFQTIRGRGATKTVARRTPPRDAEPIAKPAEDIGINMDDVQEIPGEGELATNEAMPTRDQMPEIDDEPQMEADERDHVHIMSDDDTTVIGQDELVGVKGSPVVVPTIKHEFERPISPPLTPPAHASDFKAPTVDVVDLQESSASDAPAIVNVVPDESAAVREPPARNSTIEEATKAVEDHAKFVEDATSPTESTTESFKPENDSPVSEFVVVSDVEEKPVENAPTPIESSREAVEAESKPLVVESVPTPAPEVSAPREAAEPEQAPTVVVEEPKIDIPAPVIEESKPAEEVKSVEEPKIATEEPKAAEEPKETKETEAPKAVDEPESIEAPKAVEEPKVVEEPQSVEEPVVEEPGVVEEPKVVDEPESVESPKPEGSPKATFPSLAKPSREESVSSSPPKSLLRPRVMRRATGSTAAVAGVTTSAAPATVAVTSPIDEKASARNQIARRADDALNRLAGSILRSNTSERLPPRPTSPIPSGIPRPVSPPPSSASLANAIRSNSPSNDAGTGSRSSSPAFGTARRGSVSGPRPPSRQSTLANMTNAPERSPPRQGTFANPPRGGATSPPPMPLPPQRAVSPQRQGSVRGSPNPQVPQPAVMSPSVLSRKATIDSNGSPGSPPNARRAASPPPARSPAEEFTTDQLARRNVPFPSAVEGQPIASGATVKSRGRSRTTTSGSNKPTAPNTLLATLTSKVTFPGGANPNSTADSNPVSPASAASPISPASPVSPSPASPNRSDSFASAVSNRSSIYSFSDMSDMDMSTSDLDFAGRESHRMVLNGARFDSMSSIASSDGGMSGNEEEKREKRAKRRAKARAQALKKQKRSKRN